MAKRLGYAIILTVFGAGGLLAACGDDPSGSDDVTGGAGGEPSNAAGTKSAGSTSGGNAGKTSSSDAGAGGDGAAPSDGGEPAIGGAAPGSGGASEGGAAGSDGGAEAGAGGAGAELEYACNSTTISHKVCSAFVAANCTEPTICADCVGERNGDREAFGVCAACGAEYDAFLQCGIDAFEGGNLSAGVECFDGYADLADVCAEHLYEALACTNHVVDHDCPETWPLE